MTLAEKLIEIRKEVDYLQKDTKGFNCKYVKGSSILYKIKGKMNEHKVLLIPSCRNPKYEYLNEVKETINTGGARVIETKLKKVLVQTDMSFTWVNAENKDDSMEVSWAGFGMQDDPSRAFGSMLTYSERYFLLKFFNIATDEDDPDKWEKDNKADKKGKEPKQTDTDKIIENLGILMDKAKRKDNKQFFQEKVNEALERSHLYNTVADITNTDDLKAIHKYLQDKVREEK